MPRRTPALFSALALPVLIAAAVAQSAPSQKTVVAHAGHWDLLQESVDDAIQAADILAGAAISPADEAALRNDLIAQFREDPDKQVKLYMVVVSLVRGVRGEADPWPQLASLRYNNYYRAFTPYPPFDKAPVFDRIVLKYNPVLTRNRDFLILRTSVESQFYTDTLVATIAGVPPPTQAEEDEFMRSLPARFASMPKEQQEQLAQAEIRASDFDHIYHTGIRARTDVIADIHKNVHSHGDVWAEARRLENESRVNGEYWTSWRNETGMPALCGGCIGPLLWIKTQQRVHEWQTGAHLEIQRPAWSVLSHCTQRWLGCAQPAPSGKR